MTIEYITVGVVVERRMIESPWADHVWAPYAVLPEAPDVAPWTSLGRDARGERFYLGAASFGLYPSDTGHLIDNFHDEGGRLWVSVRPTGLEPPLELVGVAADPAEGEGFLDGVGDIVEPLPMPPEIAARVLAFYKAHHVERPFIKRQRDKANRDAFAIRPGGRAVGRRGEPL
jgi:hypothetical protein